MRAALFGLAVFLCGGCMPNYSYETTPLDNQRVADRCGASASADLPVSLGAASLLRP